MYWEKETKTIEGTKKKGKAWTCGETLFWAPGRNSSNVYVIGGSAKNEFGWNQASGLGERDKKPARGLKKKVHVHRLCVHTQVSMYI